MRPIRTLAQAAFCLSTMSSLAAAWPTWMQEWHLIARQDDAEGDSEDAPVETKAPTTSTSTRRSLNTATERDPDAPQETGKAKGTGTSGGGRNSTKTQDREEFDPTDPVGAVVMVTPDIRFVQPLYKAGEFVTWVWNYTNVLAEPTAVDVILSLPTQSATWTLAGNQTFQDPQTFTWDSGVQATDVAGQLLTGQYKLIIKDSDTDMDTPPEPGYLSKSDFSIGIYIPREAIDLKDWNCATCSAAPPQLSQKALGFASSMALATVATFTWFVAGL